MVRADAQLNALVVVASPPNLALVEELVAMLDIEAAAPGAAVRVYAVQHGSAESNHRRDSANSSSSSFKTDVIRAEDRLKAIPDPRTNSIVVSTSGRSFELFEDLLAFVWTPRFRVDFREIRIIKLANSSAARSGADGAAAHGRPPGADAEGPARDRGSRKGRGHGRRPSERPRGRGRQ